MYSVANALISAKYTTEKIESHIKCFLRGASVAQR